MPGMHWSGDELKVTLTYASIINSEEKKKTLFAMLSDKLKEI